MNKIVSLICGIIFGIGLVISQMINPEKVLGFLNIFRDWDPSLAFVMIGALFVSTPIFHLFKNKSKPLFSSNFSIPTNKQIDKKLIAGSIFFGAGWGLIGLCPGPAITSIALFNISSAIFVLAMFVGFYIASKIN
tara:strand:- start:1222 stop:1626 length:405 start_codon:yes stop_codon:yes gene_type:complete